MRVSYFAGLVETSLLQCTVKAVCDMEQTITSTRYAGSQSGSFVLNTNQKSMRVSNVDMIC